ncbi:MAG TPA: hypothetical protein VFT67_12860 [Jatrophihabitantaceae bacterium]|jgi:hypothetical protein|nr:hypothetical protein [Jatrophihabitantaceae bacterium]
MTAPATVRRLVAAGRLETVPADVTAARTRLARATEKLASAKSIAEIDVEVAYVTAYDAARVAVTAHMLAIGYRAKPIARAHEAVGDYAEAMIDAPSAAQFHVLRRRRNKAEYDDILVSRADFDADLTHAEAIIDAVRNALEGL